MILTADLCRERRYSLALNCPRCRVLRATGPEEIIRRGFGARPLRLLFDEGKLRCQRCRTPADFMTVSSAPSLRGGLTETLTEWRRETPTPSP